MHCHLLFCNIPLSDSAKSHLHMHKGLQRQVVKDNAETDNVPMASKIESRCREVHPCKCSSRNYFQLPLAAGSATVDMFGLRVFNNRKSLLERAMDTLSPTCLSSAYIFSPSLRL
eukprot:15365543-Ditylum_brightwellii.AAC.2